MQSNMIYSLNDKMPFKHILLYGVQELLAIIVATLLIASICGVSVGAGLIGAGLSTLLYILITRGNSNVYVSNSGAFVAPVLFAFSIGGATAALIGGITICVMYVLFGIIFGKLNIDTMYKFLPKPLIGAITILIGLSLIGYVPTYLGDSGSWGLAIALITAFIIALVMHYGKGKTKTIPFLIAVVIGYIISIILTVTGVAQLVDFSVFKNVSMFQIPTFNFMLCGSIDLMTVLSVVIMYMAYSVSAICEVIADHQAMSVVIGDDLFKRNGVRRIFAAMGCANALSGIVSGLGQTTYGEGTGCAAASRVANARVTAMTSILLILMGFCGYVQAVIISIPSCVFAGASLILYPLISIAGFNMLINNKVDLSNAKNMLMVGIPISIGLGGIIIGGSAFSLSGTALALIVGIILNIILN